MYTVKPPFFVKPFLGNTIWRIPTEEKVLYLTFDDGPHPVITPKVLDILLEYQVKATFFCLGKNVKAHPQIFQNLLAGGHRVGSHTYDHPSGWKTDDREYMRNVTAGNEMIGSDLFRPPYGQITPTQVKLLEKKYRIVMWDVLSGDFDRNTSPERTCENVVDHARPGSVIVFHDSEKAAQNMLFALPRCIDRLQKKGFKFEPLPNVFDFLDRP